MKYGKLAAALASVALLSVPVTPRADDIDLYTGGDSVTGAPANVLIILDNSANWAAASQHWPDGGKQGVSELQTLSELALSDAIPAGVNVGLMSFAKSGSSIEGQVRFHMRPLGSENPDNRTRFSKILNYMAGNAVGGSNADEIASNSNYDILMNSAFRYFNGLARYPGINNDGEDRKDFRGNVAVPAYDPLTYPGFYSHAPGSPPASYTWAYETATQLTYNKPAEVDDGCAKNFIIFIGNGFPSNIGSAAELTAAAALIGKTADTNQVTSISPQNPYADEWARFMRNVGVPTANDDPASTTTPKAKINNKITTYTIDVCKDACDASQEKLLRSMANVGGGRYFRSTSKSEIKNALATIFAEIQAINSVFASATLPISVNTQGTYENQVYIGVFRPDGGSRPRWYGNLKEYQFARYCDLNDDDLVNDIGGPADERIDGNATPPTCSGDTLKLYLSDRDNKPAIDQYAATGFIDLTATSFWSSTSTFWGFMPSLSGSSSDSPDGPAVERGGAAQRLRAVWAGSPTSPHPDGRKIYTCLGSGCTPGVALGDHPFTTTNSDLTATLISSTKTVILSRSGNVVTATSVTPHNFVLGDPVTISGATPSAYNGTFTVTAVPTTTTFQFALNETPATAATATLSLNDVPISVSSLTLSTTTPGTNATVTATGIAAVPAGTTVATISGASQSYLNGTFTGTVVGGAFLYTVSLPATPPASQSNLTATCGTNPSEEVDGTWAADVFTFTGKGSGAQLTSGRCRNYTGSVKITGAPAGSPYNGTFTIATSGTKTLTVSYPFTYAVTPDPGLTKVITPASTTSYSVDLTRALGSTSVTATVAGGGTHIVPPGSRTVTVSAASDTAYNGVWTATITDNTTFVFGPVTVGPASPTGSITATSGGATGPSGIQLITWMRGTEVNDGSANWDENLDGTAGIRASVHGDVLHSRPLLINYGGTIGIVGFYGSNDGYLRAVKAGLGLNQSGNPYTGSSSTTLDDGTAADGGEKWAFIPSEFVSYARLSRLYANQSLIRFPNSSCSISPSPTARNYFWDGQVTAYVSPNKVSYTGTDGNTYTRPEKTYIYATMRRGGRVIYAIDVSDPNTPKFLWKIDPSRTGFGNLGYTWSEPKVTRIKGRAPGPDGSMGTADDVEDTRDVLIFGGGYDPTDDDQAPGCPRGDAHLAPGSGILGTCSNGGTGYAGIGRGVYIVDALTGNLLKYILPSGSSSPKYSVPADVSLFDFDGDGATDRVYFGDSGAQLFRISVDSTQQWPSDPSPSTSTTFLRLAHLASFGDTGRNGGTNDRRFLFPPEPVPFTYTKSDGSTVSATMILLGTGDREKPLNNRVDDGTANPPRASVSCAALYPGDSYFGNRIYDQIYGYIDRGTTPSSPATVSSLHEVTPEFDASNPTASSVSPFDLCDAFETSCSGTLKDGWLMNLRNTVNADASRDEEKMVSAPRVISGLLLFGTNTPQRPDTSRGVCSNLGQARAYAVNPFTGGPSFDRDGDGDFDQADYAAVVSGGGLPPTVTAGVVNIDGSFYRFVIGAGGEGTVSASPIAGAKNPIAVRGDRSRVYWYTPVDER